MKFYGNGIIWDKDSNKILCRFIEGSFETDDSNIIEKLKALNYKHDEEIKIPSTKRR